MKTNTIGFAFALVSILATFAHYLLGLDFVIVLVLIAVTATAYSMNKQLPAIAWWVVTVVCMYGYLSGNL